MESVQGPNKGFDTAFEAERESLVWEKTPLIHQGILNTQGLLASPVLYMYLLRWSLH